MHIPHTSYTRQSAIFAALGFTSDVYDDQVETSAMGYEMLQQRCLSCFCASSQSVQTVLTTGVMHLYYKYQSSYIRCIRSGACQISTCHRILITCAQFLLDKTIRAVCE